MGSAMKMDEWVGRHVVASRRLQTKGGTVIQQGAVMVVAGHHRGRLSLRDPGDPARTITGVNRHYEVELLGGTPADIALAAIRSALKVAENLGVQIVVESWGPLTAGDVRVR